VSSGRRSIQVRRVSSRRSSKRRPCRSYRARVGSFQHVGKPRDATSTEYLYVSVWDDVDSIRAFAGEGWQEAVITPDEERLLKDTWIAHYDALEIRDVDDLRARPVALSTQRCCSRIAALAVRPLEYSRQAIAKRRP
jgi:hypothetical protein